MNLTIFYFFECLKTLIIIDFSFCFEIQRKSKDLTMLIRIKSNKQRVPGGNREFFKFKIEKIGAV